jgi:undecaprenyl-diphosphatase
VVQAAAIIPGISRSGATIVAGLALGLQRTEAARVSFLIAVPAIVGAGVLSLKDARLAADLGYTGPQLLAGFVVAGVVGAGAIRWLLDIVRRGRMVLFAAYCFAAAALVLVLVH